MSKPLIIAGPTATGKTALGIELAKKYNGEIISADSRQVYRGMDIGTGKDIPKNIKFQISNIQSEINNEKLQIGFREKVGVPIWLVDIVNPDYQCNVGEYKKLAHAVIDDIWQRGKLPIIVGGTGLYISAIINPLTLTQIPLNPELRKELEHKNLEQLQQDLQKIGLQKFSSLNNSDKNNPRRLIRAIEIAHYYSSVILGTNRVRSPESFSSDSGRARMTKNYSSKNILLIGLTAPKKELEKRIEKRVQERYENGVIDEIKTLLQKGYSWDLPSMSATGYQPWREYITKISSVQYQISKDEREKLLHKVLDTWKLRELQYAKRQMTWFKKMKDIHWFDLTDAQSKFDIQTLVDSWYAKL